MAKIRQTAARKAGSKRTSNVLPAAKQPVAVSASFTPSLTAAPPRRVYGMPYIMRNGVKVFAPKKDASGVDTRVLQIVAVFLSRRRAEKFAEELRREGVRGVELKETGEAAE